MLPSLQLVLDGKALAGILNDKKQVKQLALLCSRCVAVVWGRLKMAIFKGCLGARQYNCTSCKVMLKGRWEGIEKA